MRAVKDFKVIRGMTVNQVVRQMLDSGGFTSKKLAEGIDILENMMKDKKCLKFLSFPADITSTGTRGLIRDLIKEKWFDAIVTTCGTLDHDIARSFGDYFHGEFEMDDIELHEKGIYRLGNILIKNDSYSRIIQ